MKTALINVFVFLLVVPFFVFAQLPRMGSVSVDELRMTQYDKDSSAEAVVLNDYSELDCSSNHTCTYTSYQKIKIFSKEGFSKASQTIYVYEDEFLGNLRGTCHVLENNKSNSYSLTEDLIHKVPEGKDNYVKFTIPNVKEGAVLEFSYSVTSNYIRVRNKNFQDDVPVKRSELVIKTLGINLGYEERSYYPWEVNQKDTEKGNYRWVVKDLPTFKNEEYVVCPSDYITAIRFFLNPPESIEKGWKEIVRGVQDDASFMKPDVDFLRPYVLEMKQKNKDSLSLMVACYDFIKENVKLKSENSIVCRPLKKVFTQKSGNAAEINLMLHSLLKEAGFSSQAILLNSRDDGKISKTSYPSKRNFNYVLAALKLKGTYYYLDATDLLRPYQFPAWNVLDCEGIVMNKKELTWVKIEPSVPYLDAWVMDLKLDSTGIFKGLGVLTKKGYSALELRTEIQQSGLEAFKKQLRKLFPLAEVSDIRVDNLEDISKSLVVYFKWQLEDTIATHSGKVLLSPILVTAFEKNPFSQRERVFPIDFKCPIEHSFRINIQYPSSFKLQSSPDEVMYKTQDNSFHYRYMKSIPVQHTITVSDKFVTKNCNYTADKYVNIKTITSKMLEKQKEDIILVK